MALSRHNSVFYDIINKPRIHEAYTVILVKQPSFHSLNTGEDKWLSKRNAQLTLKV